MERPSYKKGSRNAKKKKKYETKQTTKEAKNKQQQKLRNRCIRIWGHVFQLLADGKN